MTAITTPKPLGRRLRAPVVVAVAALMILALAPAAAQAATNTFDQSTNNDWNTAANWSQNSVPDATDDVEIPASTAAVLSSGADGVANSIDLDGQLFVTGGRTLTVGTGNSSFAGLALTVDGGGTLRLNGTTTWSAGNWTIGGGSPSGGTVENAGALNITGDVSASDLGNGQFHNLAGATINRTTASGTATLSVFFDNDGSVSVQSGTLALNRGTPPGEQSAGSYSIDASTTLIFQAFGFSHSLAATASITGAGTAKFTGSTTSLDAGATYSPATTDLSGGVLALASAGTTDRLVGPGGVRAGAGTLSVGTGASTLDNKTFSVGTTQFGVGSTVTAAGDVDVVSGATLRLNGTTTWSAGTWRVGGGSPSSGGTVENAGTLNITGDVSASDFGNGQLHNLAGATINRTTSSGTAGIARLDNDGAVSVQSGTLALRDGTPAGEQSGGSYSVAASRTLAFTGFATYSLAATASITGAGTTQLNRELTLDVDDTLALTDGTLAGTGTVAGSVSNTGGTVSPGFSTGSFRITGDYTQGSGGTLKVEVNGPTAETDFDQLQVGGAASLDGTLDLDNGAAHDPAPGAMFRIVTSATRTGTFSTVTGEQISAGKSYDVTYQADGATLVVQGAPAPDVTIDDVSVTEGDAGTTVATFTVTRSSTSGGDTTVSYATADGTASAASDYAAESGSVTFTGTETAKQITIDVNGDTLDEPNEDFFVNLSSPQNANITDNQGKATIEDDDPTPSLSIDDVTVTEGDSGTTDANFKVTLSATSGREVTVDFATQNGSATAPGDYTARSGTLTFAPGQTEKTVAVAVKGDTAVEGDETYSVGLSNASNATISAGGGAGTIVNDDVAPPPPPPSLSIGNTALREGDAGSREARLTVSLSRPSQSEVTVDYATEDGSAREPSDYSKRSGSLSFAPGQTRKVVGVPVRGDNRDEPNEAFLVELSDPRRASIGDGRGRATIRDDDEPPPPPSSETRCAGVRATILGSFRGETIIGTYRDDVIVARGGDDRVRGGAGQDLICGGGGEDDLSGGSGHDRLYGQAGDDLLRGQSGHDLLFGGPGDDRLFGDSGGEDGRGNSGEDSLFGGSGNDHLFGGPAVDACRGGSGPNSQSGCER